MHVDSAVSTLDPRAGVTMLNSASVNAVQNAKFSSRFVRPLYDSYCFANLPQTIEFLLSGKGQNGFPVDVFGSLPTHYNKVILFFIDAFGWRFFEKYAEHYEFLKTVLKYGIASQLTSQFPSTTAAHVTCIHTGLNVGQSGVYEWNYYEPLVDEVITPLLFSYAGDRERDSLKRSGIPSEAFFPRQTFYRRLQRYGIHSYIFQNQAYTPSTYSDIVYRGATVVPYRTIIEALTQLGELIVSEKTSPSYYFLYFDKIDAICHLYGPHSRQFEVVMDRFLTAMDVIFYKAAHGNSPDTLLIMTADHGQIEVDPKRTFYLNRYAPGIEHYLRTNMRGNFLVPAGSARDMFLHVREDVLDEAIAFLQKRLEGRAEIYPTRALVEQQFFGSQQLSKEFLQRVGNLVILPYEHETVWWHEERRFDMHFLGHHGGLTPEEMEIPLLLLPL